jgi:hypothetical protein
MKTALILISILSLLLTIVPSFLVLTQFITLEENKILMLVGTLGWFLTSPYWMNKNNDKENVEV